jgi:hypothetical protein
MRQPPSIIPTDRLDRDIYLVLEDFRAGAAWRETDEGDTDVLTVLEELLTGQYGAAAARRNFQSSRTLVARCYRGNCIGTGLPDFGGRPRGFRSLAGVRREQHRTKDRRPTGAAAPLADVTSDERR